MSRATPRDADQAPLLKQALGPGVAKREGRHLRPQRLVEVLGREVEVARAELPQHPLDGVHRRPPTRRLASSSINQPFGAFSLMPITQPAEMPLAHPQQLARLDAAQRPAVAASDRLANPRHPHLRMHPIRSG
jgi:hypothetical protein